MSSSSVEDAKKAWLIRNSWGTDWGTNGYGWFGYGQGAQGLEYYSNCGIPGPNTNPDPWSKRRLHSGVDQLELRVHGTHTVALTSLASAGYRWSAAVDNPKVVQGVERLAHGRSGGTGFGREQPR